MSTMRTLEMVCEDMLLVLGLFLLSAVMISSVTMLFLTELVWLQPRPWQDLHGWVEALVEYLENWRGHGI